MPSKRPSSPRGPRPRGAASRPRPRAGSRPASRPGSRPAARSRTTPAQAPPRPRVTGRAVVLVLVLVVLAMSYASSMRAYLEQKEHLASVRASIAESEENIAALQREKRRWHDPAFLEAQATQRLGWVMPGEIGFQVIDEDGKPLDHEDSLSDPDAIEVENEPAWWETAWGTMEAAGHPEDVPNPVEEIDPPKKGQE